MRSFARNVAITLAGHLAVCGLGPTTLAYCVGAAGIANLGRCTVEKTKVKNVEDFASLGTTVWP